MLDIKYIIDNLEEVIEKLNRRNGNFEHLRNLLLLNDKRKNIILTVEKKKAERNNISKEIGRYKREGLDTKKLFSSVDDLGASIKNSDDELRIVEEEINNILLNTPNIPHQSVPTGVDENSNLEIRKVGEPRKFDFEIKDHVQLGENLDILDFERAAKITGARFVVYKGLGARLERALIQFMMDLHTFEHGYKEIIPPYIVNNDSMYGTGQFPKFKGEAFKLENFDWYLNPTAEVPTINMHRNEILDASILPLKYVAYSTAFRSEAGSAGKDTKGILRQHQFNKVELIKISKPEESYQDLEDLLKNSEEVLKRLKLPYRVVSLCTGDLGFAAAKTYDIEVWLPGQDKYREIGSISNDEEFQARRSQIRLKRSKDEKTEYVHTINGSGLAVGRTVIAILENYQNADGSITIPEVLVPYMRVNKIKK